MRLRLIAVLPAVALLARGVFAQDKDLLPMSFVKPDSMVARRLERDWRRMQSTGREWAYCVHSWKVERTKDADTIFVITDLRLVTTGTQRHELAEFTCSSRGRPSMPIVHAHPGGDCSPSRADAIYAVAHGTPFALILCGPRSTSGYTAQQFLWISRGVLTERGAFIATDYQPR